MALHLTRGKLLQLGVLSIWLCTRLSAGCVRLASLSAGMTPRVSVRPAPQTLLSRVEVQSTKLEDLVNLL